MRKFEKYKYCPDCASYMYDVTSIMHYDGELGGKTPIMTDKRTGKNIGVNREMSPMDIQKLNKMYPCEKQLAPDLRITIRHMMSHMEALEHEKAILQNQLKSEKAETENLRNHIRQLENEKRESADKVLRRFY